MQQLKYQHNFFLSITVAMFFTTILPVFEITPVLARQECDTIREVPPSSKLREIKIDRFGIVFKIPGNYRTTSKQSRGQSIEIFSPVEYEYLECIKRNRITTEADSTAEVSIVPTGGRYQTATEFTKSGLISDNFYRLIKTTKIAGQPALIYEASRKGFITAIFLSPDKQLGITIYTLNEENNPNISRIFDEILTSFKFGTKTAEPRTIQANVPVNQVATKLSANNRKGCVDDRELKKGPLEFYILYDRENASSNPRTLINIREKPTIKSLAVHTAYSGNPVIILQQVAQNDYCWLKVNVTTSSKNDSTSYITVTGWVRGDLVTEDKSP